jgi:hypothetical protein
MLKKFFLALTLAVQFTLSGCAALAPFPSPAPEEYIWKVVYVESINSYAMKLYVPPCEGKNTLCDRATQVSLLEGSLYPVKVTSTNIHSMDTKFPYIGTLKSGQTIQMENDCSIHVCFERPSTATGQEYIRNELMSGRDVLIAKSNKTMFQRDLYISSSGFADGIEKLREMNSKPTPRDRAL